MFSVGWQAVAITTSERTGEEETETETEWTEGQHGETYYYVTVHMKNVIVLDFRDV